MFLKDANTSNIKSRLKLSLKTAKINWCNSLNLYRIYKTKEKLVRLMCSLVKN